MDLLSIIGIKKPKKYKSRRDMDIDKRKHKEKVK